MPLWARGRIEDAIFRNDEVVGSNPGQTMLKEFYKTRCQEKSSASTGGEVSFSRSLFIELIDPAPFARRKVNQLSPASRVVIALHSPNTVLETGLPSGPSEKMAAKLAWGGKWDTFSSPVCAQASRNSAYFGRFCGNCSLVSLQSRLPGGEKWIRTLGTGLKPIKSDVCVSCTESTSSEILPGLAALEPEKAAE
jgi:hypothetical protein